MKASEEILSRNDVEFMSEQVEPVSPRSSKSSAHTSALSYST
jgi:hypothetical protein